MSVRLIWTTAQAAYDYRCSQELQREDRGGKVWRLVAIHDTGGGTFHRGQVPRYQSGMHAVWPADSADALALDLRVSDGAVSRLVERVSDDWHAHPGHASDCASWERDERRRCPCKDAAFAALEGMRSSCGGQVAQ